MPAIQDLMGKRVAPDDLTRFCADAMVRCGLAPEDAALSADVLVTTDTWGTHSHGTRQLRQLLKNVKDGRIRPAAHPALLREGPAWALFDAAGAMPMVVGCRAMEAAMAKAAAAGIGYAGVAHSSHFGAAGYYATLALRRSMIGISTTNVDPCMAVTGARAPVIGTNPIAFAAPAGRERPVFLDVATSIVAVTKVMIAKAMGKPVPDGWLLDQEGRPTTDAGGYPDRSVLQPMAGYKGYGLALLVEILAGVLTGAAMLSGVKSWVTEGVGPADQGHAFIAVNVAAIMPLPEFTARMDAMIREIKAAPRAVGVERIYLPGEMEWERRDAALARGMQLPEFVLANLLGLAEDVGMSRELAAIFR
ncbi:MAG: Ldh family oxidoreductase [Candidatus Methylomirabilales bacterium]